VTASPNPKYRVGIIGCGRAATPRARAFDVHPLCKVVAIADTDPENLEIGCRRFGVPGYDTYAEMLERERIDIALPILPVRPNADAVVAAAEAGVKAIFCEKPLTASLEDADRMVEACRSRNVLLGAGEGVAPSRSHPHHASPRGPEPGDVSREKPMVLQEGRLRPGLVYGPDGAG